MLADGTLLGVSVVVQLTAAVLAFRLGRLTGHRGAFALIGAAIALMAVRRMTTLARVVFDAGYEPDQVAEWIALSISTLLLIGIAGIGPELRSIGTARRRAAELGHILEESLNEIYVFDAETLRFLQVNRGARENLGYSMEELQHLTPVDLKPDLSSEDFERLLEPLRTGASQVIHFSTHHLRKDGSRYPVEVQLQLSAAGPRPAFVAIILDVAERQRVEGERRRLELAMEQAGEGITILDRKGQIRYANASFAAMMARPRDRIVGGSIRELAFGEGDDDLLEQIGSSLARGETWRGRYRSVWQDHSVHVRDATVAPVRDAEGVLKHYVGVIRDVSREVELEQELLQAQKMEAVGQLAGGVAHDFNNLLTVIGGYAESLIEELDPRSDSHDSAVHILRASDRAVALTRQLLTFSRKDLSRPRPLDPNAALASMREMLRRLIGEDVVVNILPGQHIGWVRIDPGQFEQVVMNLAINARDAMPDGGELTLETRELEEAPAGVADDAEPPSDRFVVLRVSDTGVGMCEDTQRRIFEPFFTTKETGRGTGLGLSTVYGILSAVGGCVRVESARGKGSTFELFLPRIEPQLPAAEHERAAMRGAAAASQSILLVEDEDMLRELVRRVLEARGYRVTAACDGQEALEEVARRGECFDLVVTDVVMPRLSGPELVRRLRERDPQLRVVMTSGYPDRAGTAAASEELYDVFLSKPFHAEELLAAVAQAIASQEEERLDGAGAKSDA